MDERVAFFQLRDGGGQRARADDMAEPAAARRGPMRRSA